MTTFVDPGSIKRALGIQSKADKQFDQDCAENPQTTWAQSSFFTKVLRIPDFMNCVVQNKVREIVRNADEASVQLALDRIVTLEQAKTPPRKQPNNGLGKPVERQEQKK